GTGYAAHHASVTDPAHKQDPSPPRSGDEFQWPPTEDAVNDQILWLHDEQTSVGTEPATPDVPPQPGWARREDDAREPGPPSDVVLRRRPRLNPPPVVALPPIVAPPVVAPAPIAARPTRRHPAVYVSALVASFACGLLVHRYIGDDLLKSTKASLQTAESTAAAALESHILQPIRSVEPASPTLVPPILPASSAPEVVPRTPAPEPKGGLQQTEPSASRAERVPKRNVEERAPPKRVSPSGIDTPSGTATALVAATTGAAPPDLKASTDMPDRATE